MPTLISYEYIQTIKNVQRTEYNISKRNGKWINIFSNGVTACEMFQMLLLIDYCFFFLFYCVLVYICFFMRYNKKKFCYLQELQIHNDAVAER